MNPATRANCGVSELAVPATEEVECSECGLDPVCHLLDYAAQGSGVPPGILFRRRFVPAGGVLFSAGGPFHSVYAVKSGSFKAVTEDAAGRDRVVGFSFPGELMAAEALAGGRYTATVRALEPSQVCALRLHQLATSGRPTEAIQQAIIEMLGREVAFAHQVASSLIKQNSEQRLAAFLVSLSGRLKSRGFQQDRLRLSMSRSDIASYLGLARETVSRLLTRFHSQRLILQQGKQLRLLRRDELEHIALSG